MFIYKKSIKNEKLFKLMSFSFILLKLLEFFNELIVDCNFEDELYKDFVFLLSDKNIIFTIFIKVTNVNLKSLILSY